MNLNFPVSKSHMAFIFSVNKMFQNWPKSVYLWTFTFTCVMPDHRYMMRWAEFTDWLGNKEQYLRGLRVVEVHPGKVHSRNIWGLSHGLHFHALFNTRVSIHEIKRVSKRFDIGIVDVKTCKDVGHGLYIGKYLTKDDMLPKGMRRWGTIGSRTGGWHHTHVRDVEIESQFHRTFRQVQAAVGQQQLSCDVVHSVYVNSRLYGDLSNWPRDRFYYSGRSREILHPDAMCTRVQEFANPTLKPLKLSPRGDKKETMEQTAKRWKQWAHYRAIGPQAYAAEKARQARQEVASNASGKKFLENSPRGIPGDSLGQERDTPWSGTSRIWTS